MKARPRTDFVWFRALAAACLACALAAGCAGPFSRGSTDGRTGTPSATSGAPAPEDGYYEEWFRIYTVEIRGLTPERTLRGYLRRRFAPGKEPIHYVYDLDHGQLGFISPSGKTYRLRRDDSGGPSYTEVGFEGLDRGVLKLLGVRGALEYAGMTGESR